LVIFQLGHLSISLVFNLSLTTIQERSMILLLSYIHL
jgi:hypothetical protein